MLKGLIWVRILTLLYALANSPLLAESFDVGTKGEIAIYLNLQGDTIIAKKCPDQDCPSNIDGRRLTNLSLRYNYFENIKTNYFAEASLDYSKDINSIFITLDSELESVIREIDPPFDVSTDDKTLENAVLGIRTELLEARLGRQTPESDRFSPTKTNYLNFSLSAFDDDRVLGTSFSYGDIFSLASYRQNYSAIIMQSVTKSDGSEPELEYEFYFDTRIKGKENILFTLTTRSTNWGSNQDSFRTHGIKFHIFKNNGNTYTAAVSANDLGKYIEFVFSRDWAYRHRVQLGASIFSSKPDNGFELLENPPGSAKFYSASYTYAVSRYLNTFAEIDTFRESGERFRNVVVGLRYFF